jgi:hypothetical protein
MSRFESREKMKNSSSFPGNDGATKPSLMKRNISLSAPSSGASLQTLWESGDQTDAGKASDLKRLDAFSYPEPFLRAVRRGALAKSITGYHKNMVIEYIRY